MQDERAHGCYFKIMDTRGIDLIGVVEDDAHHCSPPMQDERAHG